MGIVANFGDPSQPSNRIIPQDNNSRSDLLVKIMDRLLNVHKTGTVGAVLARVKLMQEFSSLKAVQFMVAFIKSYCSAEVLDEPTINVQ